MKGGVVAVDGARCLLACAIIAVSGVREQIKERTYR